MACGIRVRRYRYHRLRVWVGERLSPKIRVAFKASVRPSNGILLTFIETSEAVRQRVRDAMAAAQDTQKEHSDRQGRKNTHVFKLGDQVLLNAKNLPIQAVTAVGSTKLRPRFVGPFTVIGVHSNAYTLDLPSTMATHPTFYVGLLKPYRPAEADDSDSPTSSSTAEGRSPSSASSQLGMGLEQPAEQRPSEGSDPPVRPRGHRAVGSSENDPGGHRGPPEGIVQLSEQR
ncbi:hypothetical protein PRIC2_005908 [Phytophthora ramorum]